MMQYYSPNFSVFSLIKALFTIHAEEKLINYFKNYTQKEYILITNSCRTSLYLAYLSIPVKGEVVTNPLSCKVAFEPIIESGNEIKYTDIDKDSLTMQTGDLAGLINDNTIAIQAIHQGGYLCNMAEIIEHIKGRNIYLIEDCAQGLFSAYNHENAGIHSDIACFSLIKNAYGIGGGILATNDKAIYSKAREISRSLLKPSLMLILFRILRNLLETKRKNKFIDMAYNRLMRNRKHADTFNKSTNEFKLKITQPLSLEEKIAWVQLLKAQKLNKLRKNNGQILLYKLQNGGLMRNYMNMEKYDSAFTKFFIINDRATSQKAIPALNIAGIESKHLEQKYEQYYQERLDRSDNPDYLSNIKECINYLEIHDQLISLPLVENMSEFEMDEIIKILKEVISHE